MSETQTLGPCTECGTPRDACTGPDYCCDECLHFPPDWEGYGPTAVTAPDPAGPTDAEALNPLWEEAAALLYPGLFPDEAYRRHPRQIDRVATALADRERAALDAQEAVRRVEALADELLASRYDSGTDHGYGYSDGLAEAADRIHAVVAAAVEGERT